MGTDNYPESVFMSKNEFFSYGFLFIHTLKQRAIGLTKWCSLLIQMMQVCGRTFPADHFFPGIPSNALGLIIPKQNCPVRTHNI